MSAAAFLQLCGRQVSAAIFGILLLALIIVTFVLYPAGAALPRYDFLFLAALAIQIGLIVGGLETWNEAKVILVFHLVGTVMELFKTSVGSWAYPEASFLRIAGVPLFSGFMYAAVGSYIARSWRLHDFKLTNYPNFWWTAALAGAIYVNFFTHHYALDARWFLFAAGLALFWRCRVDAELADGWRITAPVLALFLAVATLIYAAENIATYGRAWIYPSQAAGWIPVSPAKLGSWLLLMLLSWVLVSALRRTDLRARPEIA